MRFVYIFLIVALLVAGTSAKKHKHEVEKDVLENRIIYASEFSFYDFGTFLGGLFRGIEIGINPKNATNCFKQADSIGEHFAKSFHLLSIGFNNVSAETVNQSIQEMGNAFVLIEPLIEACGGTTMVIKIASITHSIQTGGIAAFVTQEGLKVLAKKGEIGADLRGITANFQGGNYEASGESLGKLLALIIQ